MDNLWQRYVKTLVNQAGHTQVQAQRATGIAQTTISRWLLGSHTPTDTAKVVLLATGYGRNVLEAFVAAGMIDVDTARRGLEPSSLDFLAKLQGLPAEASDDLARRRREREAELSAVDPRVQHLYDEPSVAHPEPRFDVEGDEEPEGP